MQQTLKLSLGLALTSLSCSMYANTINLQAGTGTGWANTHYTHNLYLNPFVENSYATQNTSNAALASVGISYQWQHLSQQPLAAELGLHTFYARYNIAGVNSPFINAGQFDTLNYLATDTLYLLFTEARLLYTRYAVHPYAVAGIGAAWHHLANYQEAASNSLLSAAPMPQPFRNNNTTQFAYELGVGAETVVLQTLHHHTLNVFIDYRFVDAGNMQLNPSPLQSTTTGLRLGRLHMHLLNVGLSYQFA